jgi:hypothetical protein
LDTSTSEDIISIITLCKCPRPAQENAIDVERRVSAMIPDSSGAKHHVYSFLEVLLGKGVNGGLVDEYIELLLSNNRKSISLIKHHFFQYGDVGLSQSTEIIPDGLCRRVFILYYVFFTQP